MQLIVDFTHPLIKEEEVLMVSTADLDEFYTKADGWDKNNIFFILLNSLHYYAAQEKYSLAAHLSFLAAYYLFSALTPPASAELAVHYMKKAVEYDPLPIYSEWLELVEKGN